MAEHLKGNSDGAKTPEWQIKGNENFNSPKSGFDSKSYKERKIAIKKQEA